MATWNDHTAAVKRVQIRAGQMEAQSIGTDGSVVLWDLRKMEAVSHFRGPEKMLLAADIHLNADLYGWYV